MGGQSLRTCAAARRKAVAQKFPVHVIARDDRRVRCESTERQRVENHSSREGPKLRMSFERRAPNVDYVIDHRISTGTRLLGKLNEFLCKKNAKITMSQVAKQQRQIFGRYQHNVWQTKRCFRHDTQLNSRDVCRTVLGSMERACVSLVRQTDRQMYGKRANERASELATEQACGCKPEVGPLQIQLDQLLLGSAGERNAPMIALFLSLSLSRSLSLSPPAAGVRVDVSPWGGSPP